MPPKTDSRESVKVAVRLRPMSSTETSQGYHSVVEIDQESASVRITNPQGQPISFSFDYAFPDSCTQEEVYEMTSASIVSGVLEGYNGTIFAYGQTGTGKTYSMDGKSHGEHRGIVPRAFDHIFDYMAANSDSQQFLVTVTYVEIYNDEIRDLLAAQQVPLKIREDPAHGITIKGVVTHKVNDIEDLRTLIKYGKKNRKVRKTNMNAESSRSHSILTVCVETLSKIDGQEHVRSARLNLVDLAGSERVAKTGAEGVGFLEGVNINYELMILGNCISALTSKGQTHIPYRDSKLTMLLRDSLGGNARTLMIAALGPADYNFSETMSTLRYAERAKKIENKPKVNMDPKDALLLKLKEELSELEKKLNQKDTISAQMGASEDVIQAMEKTLEEQRQELAKASQGALKERELLQKKLDEQMSKIDAEKHKREKYQARLNELSKVLSETDSDKLFAKTRKNESEINQIREKLRQREERSKLLQKEISDRREKHEMVSTKCTTIQSDVEAVTKDYDESVNQYQNLKIMLPEIQRTIQEDREQLSSDISSLTSQMEFLMQVMENFIPQAEVERIKKNAVFNEETNQWNIPQADKKELVKVVISKERPKSANGYPRPIATSEHLAIEAQSRPNISMSPQVVPGKNRKGPVTIKLRALEKAVEQAFLDAERNIMASLNENCHHTVIAKSINHSRSFDPGNTIINISC